MNTPIDNATKRPWAILAYPNERELHPMVTIFRDCELREDIVCNSCNPDDAKLIVQAVNEYEALKQLEVSVRAFMPAFNELHPDASTLGATEDIDQALATLNAVRK